LTIADSARMVPRVPKAPIAFAPVNTHMSLIVSKNKGAGQERSTCARNAIQPALAHIWEVWPRTCPRFHFFLCFGRHNSQACVPGFPFSSILSNPLLPSLSSNSITGIISGTRTDSVRYFRTSTTQPRRFSRTLWMVTKKQQLLHSWTAISLGKGKALGFPEFIVRHKAPRLEQVADGKRC
jgi:hypothetical protein